MQRNYTRLIFSLLAAILVVGFAVFSGSTNTSRIFMNGGLSSPHAPFEGDCRSCHVSWAGVKDRACEKCHGEMKHRESRSLDGAAHGADRPGGCYVCHGEHRGVYHNIALVEDARCGACHKEEDVRHEARTGCIACHPYHAS